MNIEITITSNQSQDNTLKYLKEVLLDDAVSDICMRLERQFDIFIKGKETNIFLIEDHFVTPPAKGEIYFFKEKHYRVLEIIHYYFAKEPSKILVEETLL
jgi:hypothetical protein